MRWTFAAVLVALMASLGWAQPQTDGGRGDRSGAGQPMMRPRGWGQRMGDGRPFWSISEEEWGQVQQFMKENSPQRWQAYQDLSGEQQEKLKMTIARRYRMLQFLKNNEPEMYDVRLKRMGVEDQIFGLTRELKSATPADRPKIEEKLKSKLGDLVDLGIQEHQARIQRFQKLISQEQDQLSREQSNREQIVNKHLKAIEHERGRLGGTEPTTAPTTQNSTADQAP